MNERIRNGRWQGWRGLRPIGGRTAALLLAAATFALVSCGGGGNGSDVGVGQGGGLAIDEVEFVVTNGASLPVAGAVVWLVPAAAIDGSPIDGEDIRDGSAVNRDEPLEDAIAGAGGGYPHATTNAAGVARLSGISLGRYFWYVAPTDGEHLPGGSGSRVSLEASVFLGTSVPLELSSRPGATATHVGSTTCLVCHPSLATTSGHAHRLGFSVPGNPAPQQDYSRYPDFMDGYDRFLPAAAFTGGTPIWCSDFDPNGGDDKFKTSLSDPTSLGQTVQIIAWLWRDTADSKFKITLQNVANLADPSSPRTFEVPLTYGGALRRQLPMVRVPGRIGLFPLLQFQSEGEENRFDRTRKVYRDYHLDRFWDSANQLLVDPPLGSHMEANCAACHFTGLNRYQDSGSGQWFSDAVNDPAGAFDIDGDGFKDEINVGCESCHGPGSDHVAWAGNPANNGHEGRYIVDPEDLSASREMLICGRCHDRPIGNGPVPNEEPLDLQGRFPGVGISRAEYLQNFVTRSGPASTDYWGDELHSRSHHQQYSDLVKSTMHRNDRILTTCTDCHDSHGSSPFRDHLVANPDNTNSFLCGRCHSQDPLTHMLEKTGSTHAGNLTSCIQCHMADTARSGAGTFGILLGVPNGTVGDDDKVFYQNDLSSHLFLSIAHKTHPAVAGVQPTAAMPIPYTRGCGALCHDAAALPLMSSSAPSSPAHREVLEPDGPGGPTLIQAPGIPHPGPTGR